MGIALPMRGRRVAGPVPPRPLCCGVRRHPAPRRQCLAPSSRLDGDNACHVGRYAQRRAGATPHRVRQLPSGEGGLELRGMPRPHAHRVGHADEVGDRSGVHLLHDPGAMDLDGLFARTQGIRQSVC